MTTRPVRTVWKKKLNCNFWKHVLRGDIIIFDRLRHAGYMVLIQLSQDYGFIAHLRYRLQSQ